MGNTRSGDHLINDGPTYLWTVELTVEDLGRYRYIVLADTSEEAVDSAFKYIHRAYANPVVIHIIMCREKELILPAI